MNVKAQIFEILNHVPDAELPVILEVVKHFVPLTSDDIATRDDIAAHGVAMKEYFSGETIAHSAINWD